MQQRQLVFSITHIPDKLGRLPEMKGLSHLLACSKKQPQTGGEEALAARSMWRGDAFLAAQTALGLPENTPLLWAAPVYQNAGMNGIQMAHGGFLGLDRPEASRWCALMNEELLPQGYTLLPWQTDLWCLRLPETADFHAPSIWSIHGNATPDNRPQGRHAATLASLGVEMQMWLHTHADNTRRRQNALPPVNGIWLFDRLPEGTAPDFPLFDNASTRFEDIHDNAIIRLDTAAHESVAAALSAWESTWFTPAAQALRDGSLSVTIDTAHATWRTVRRRLFFFRPRRVENYL